MNTSHELSISLPCLTLGLSCSHLIVANTHPRCRVAMSAQRAWRALGIGARLGQARIASWAACVAIVISAQACGAHAVTSGMLATGPRRARRTLGGGRHAEALHHTMACCAHAATTCRVALRICWTGWTLRIGATVWQTGFAYCFRCRWAWIIAISTITTILACHTSPSCIAARAATVVVALLIPIAIDAWVSASSCWRCSTRSSAHILDMLTDSALQQGRLLCIAEASGIRTRTRTHGRHVLN